MVDGKSIDRENAIANLEQNIRWIEDNEHHQFPGWCNVVVAMRDAVELLKEQEARVLDWDEVKNYPVVYGEFKGVKDIFPLIITVDNYGRCLSWNPGINVSDEFLFLTYDEEDRKNTRCWNKMPTDKQRQEMKWE